MGQIRLITHDGKCHADEVFAFVCLKRCYSETENIELVRTRELPAVTENDIVFDIGNGKYDHHTTNKRFRANGIPYAAFGLIWLDYAEKYISSLDSDLSEEQIQEIKLNVDKILVEGIDAVDNGIYQKQIKKKYSQYTVSMIITSFNNNNTDSDFTFNAAANIAETILMELVTSQIREIKDRDVILTAIDEQKESKILILDRNIAWKKCLKTTDFLYVVSPTDDGERYKVRAVQDNKTLQPRKPFPKEWAGLENVALQNKTAIPDAIFCHPGRFLVGTKTQASAIKIAKMALAH